MSLMPLPGEWRIQKQENGTYSSVPILMSFYQWHVMVNIRTEMYQDRGTQSDLADQGLDFERHRTWDQGAQSQLMKSS